MVVAIECGPVTPRHATLVWWCTAAAAFCWCRPVSPLMQTDQPLQPFHSGCSPFTHVCSPFTHVCSPFTHVCCSQARLFECSFTNVGTAAAALLLFYPTVPFLRSRRHNKELPPADIRQPSACVVSPRIGTRGRVFSSSVSAYLATRRAKLKTRAVASSVDKGRQGQTRADDGGREQLGRACR
jgi:hypothetical protein